MLLCFVQNIFFKSKIILLCVIIAIQHTNRSETSERKTQLAKQAQGRKRTLRKNKCRKFSVKLVLSNTLDSSLNFILVQSESNLLMHAFHKRN